MTQTTPSSPVIHQDLNQTVASSSQPKSTSDHTQAHSISQSQPSILQNSTLLVATLVLGVMAGFFWTYSINVNLAMLQVDGAVYAQVQSLFNQNVRHGMFFTFFFGGGAFTFLALITHIKHFRSLRFWLICAAVLVYILGIIFFTREINLPLNYYTESWNPQALPDDWQQVRAQWNQANNLRVITSMAAFILSLVAMTQDLSTFKSKR